LRRRSHNQVPDRNKRDGSQYRQNLFH
jgi:hypothetical protein